MLWTLIALGIAWAAWWAALSKKKSMKEDKVFENKSWKTKKHEKRDFELSDWQVEKLKEISDKKINIKKTKRVQKVDDSLNNKAEKVSKTKRTKKVSNELLEAENKIVSIENEYLKDIDERYISNSELQFLKKLIGKCSDEILNYLWSIKKEKHELFFQILEWNFSRNEHNEKFLEKEAKIQWEYFKQFEEHWLTDKQLQAVLTDEDAVLVNAWAWTGKTKTIESKILYLHNIKHIPLNEILVITFAKKSQRDMMKRIIEALNQSWVEVKKEDLEETISTFHAFGKRILDEYDEKNWIIYEPHKTIWRWRVGRRVVTPEDEWNPLWWIILWIIEEMKTGPMKDELIQYLTYFSRPKLQVQDYDSRWLYYEDVKKTYISLLRDPDSWFSYHVKSYWELMIANYFAMHWIPALYEPKDYFYTNNKRHKKNYKPDFVIPEVKDEEWNIIREKIYIEYFWVDKDWNTAPYIDNVDYVQKMNEKIRQHAKSHNILIDLRYSDFQEWYNALLWKLERELKNYWVSIKELDYEEKFKVLWDEEWTFEQLLKTFLSLYKESDETIESLREKANIIDADNYERMQTFLNIFQVFLDRYNEELKKNAYMDFWDMIYEAKRILISWAVERKYKYILVDEFQDISEARAWLINTLIEDPYETKLFCVWDDWQSIYNFSWSNINIFLKFDSYFWYTKYITLDKTFRFNQWISDVSGSFIMMNPEQNKKSLTALDPTVKWRFEIFQKVPAREIWNDEEKLQSTHFVTYERILRSLLDDFINNFSEDNEKEFKDWYCQISILYLARYKFENLLKNWKSTFLTYLQNVYSIKEPEWEEDFFTVKVWYQWYKFDIKITPFTIHKSKWLQATYVLVDYVNQVEKWYSFPSSMTDDPLLYLVINDDKKWYPNAEERRLFYVAITRWIKKVYLCYEKNKESSFLRDLIKAWKQIKKSVINVTKDDQTWETISLLERYEAPKCVKCWWRILSSLERSTDDPKIKSYYCSNLWMWCDATYYDFEWKRYLAPYCPNWCWERMLIRKSGNSTEYFRWCKNFLLTRCSWNLRLEKWEVIEDTGEDWDVASVVTEVDDVYWWVISDLYEVEHYHTATEQEEVSHENVVDIEDANEVETNNNITKTYANNGQRRTDEELQMLKDMVYDGKTIEEMAEVLQRKPSAIIGKLPGPSISNDLLVSILNCEEINSLSFQTLNELSEYQAKMLWTFKWDSIYFSVLDHLDKWVTAQLSKFQWSRLYLNWIKHLSELDATYLSKFWWEILSLQWLQSIEEWCAEKLKEFTGTLMLPNALEFVKEWEKNESNKNTKIDISRIIPFMPPELKKERKEKVKTLSSNNKVIYFKIRSILLKANSEMWKRVDCNIPIVIENKPHTKEALINDLWISEEEFEQCWDKLLEFIKSNL